MKKQKPKLTTTKKLIIFLFANSLIIEFFTMAILAWSLALSSATGIAPDYTPLNTLVGTVIGEVIGFGVYAVKSTIENREGGITYLAAQRELESEDEDNDVDNQ